MLYCFYYGQRCTNYDFKFFSIFTIDVLSNCADCPQMMLNLTFIQILKGRAKMKLKKIFCAMAVTTIFISSGCSGESSQNGEETTETYVMAEKSTDYEENTPEYVVDSFFKAFEVSDAVSMKSYMADDYFTLDSLYSKKNETTETLINTMTDNFEYTIKNAQINGDSAYVETEILNLPMDLIMMDALSNYDVGGLTDSKKLSEEEADLELAKNLSEVIDKYEDEKKSSTTVKINLTKEDKGWAIVNDTDLFDAMTGNYISFTIRNLKNFVNESNESSSQSVQIK